jgi:hypothetical protein
MNRTGIDKHVPNTARTGERLREDEKEAEVGEQVSQDLRFVHRNPYCKCSTIPLFSRANTELQVSQVLGIPQYITCEL